MDHQILKQRNTFHLALAAILGLMISSCGENKKAQFRKDMAAKLELGKKVAFNSMTQHFSNAPGLHLIQPFATKKEVGTNYTGWALMNTEVMPEVKKQDLAAFALRYIDQGKLMFQVPSQELFEAKRHIQEIQDEMISVNFIRRHQNLLVRDAFVEVIFSKNANGLFQLREVVNHSFGSFTLENDGEPTVDVARVLAESGQSDLIIENQRGLILAQGLVNQVYKMFLATEVEVSDEANDETYTLTYINGTEVLAEAYAHRIHLEGRILGRAYNSNYLDNATVTFPLRLTEFSSNGLTSATDVQGRFEIQAPIQGQVALTSNRVSVFDNNTGELVSLEANLTEGDNVLGNNPLEVKALNAFTSIHRINRFAREFISSTEVPYLDTPSNVVLNVPGSCNAFYDTRFNSVNFFIEGDGCADTALLNDVIHHEWGHGLDFFTGRQGGITDGAFSEGIGDIVGTYFSNTSVLARGFPLDQNQGIRNVENNARFPEDQGEVHVEGLIIGGAFWDLKKSMEERYGVSRGRHESGRLFFRHLLTADTYQESYATVLRLDDNDGNPVTPSPNHCLINAAFAKHGLAEPENCSDVVEALPLKDPELYVDIKEAGPAGYMLMASGIEGHDVVVCISELKECLARESFDATLTFEGVDEEGRHFFQSAAPLAIPLQSNLSLVRRDKEGQILGYRQLKFVGQ